MRIAIIQLPNSPCEYEVATAATTAGLDPVAISWSSLVEGTDDFAGYILVGAPYGNPIEASLLGAFDPGSQALQHQAKLGKPILGVGSGAQILVEAGLVPGLSDNQVGLGLVATANTVATAKAYLNPQAQYNAFTRYLSPQHPISLSTIVGSYYIPPGLRQELQFQGLDVLYADEALTTVAGIANKAGNVLALTGWPDATTAKPQPMLRAMHDYIREQRYTAVRELDYQPRLAPCRQYPLDDIRQAVVLQSSALTTETQYLNETLAAAHLAVNIKRFLHYQFETIAELDQLLQIHNYTIVAQSAEPTDGFLVKLRHQSSQLSMIWQGVELKLLKRLCNPSIYDYYDYRR